MENFKITVGYGIPAKEIRNMEFLRSVLEDIEKEKELLENEENSKLEFIEKVAEILQEKFDNITFTSWPKVNGNDNLMMEIEGDCYNETKEIYNEVSRFLGMDGRIYSSLHYRC